MTGGSSPDMFLLRVHLTVIPAMCSEGTRSCQDALPRSPACVVVPL